ncbi:MAG TPA: hypothetical protein H9870_12875 [Candidatus Corynebacterium avicola]|uniref:Secreted protein n=1 Tax=Candidatus Corynebacterium avicola TaxID=2838527 RepID=A0A9D1RQV7_9CORY|nr:hypothetical protein [Candidatus Corynebacterium avicola]
MTRTTLLSRRPATAAIAVLTTGLLTLTACNDSSEDSTATTDASEASETTAATEATDASESTEASESEAAESSTEDAPEGAFTVQAQGSSPVGLVTNDSPSEEQEEQTYTINGRLIIGPGSCFALKESGSRGGDDLPRPLVVPDGSTFTRDSEQPSITLPDEDEPITVGDDVTLDVVSVQLTDLKGLPDQCARGGSKSGLVVQ